MSRHRNVRNLDEDDYYDEDYDDYYDEDYDEDEYYLEQQREKERKQKADAAKKAKQNQLKQQQLQKQQQHLRSDSTESISKRQRPKHTSVRFQTRNSKRHFISYI